MPEQIPYDVEIPDQLQRLLREVIRRNGLGGSGVLINRRFGGGWSAKFGNQMLLSPDRTRTDWLLIEYPPPRLPLSETVVEVGP